MTTTSLPPLRVVGQPIPRPDGRAKLNGTAVYAGDVSLPGLLHAGLVRSPVPHGRIVSVDTSAALRVPGVERILTGADMPGLVKANRYGAVVKDCPLIAEDVVRYEGEPVAMVIARDEQAVAAAVSAVAVEYAELPVLVDVYDALRPDMPRLHAGAETGAFAGKASDGYDPTRNIAGQYHDLRGNPDEALERSDHVFTHAYWVPAVHHVALENVAAVAAPDGDGFVVYSGNQYPFLMSKLLGELLGLPESSVRVVVPFVGGSFGSKEYVNVLPLAAVAAKATRRPVRLELTLEESFRTMSRHGAFVQFTSGVQNDGTLTARKINLLFDTGAYADQGPRVVRQGGYRAPGPYRLPHLQVDAYAIYTNKVPAGAYRGFGASQPIYGCECHMDEIATALKLDPIAFRRQNLLGLSDDFDKGDLPLDCDMPATLDAVLEEFEHLPKAPDDGRLRGVGIAMGVKNTASGPLPSAATVRLHADGSATVLATSVEMGQGTQTMLCQVAAEALGLPATKVRVVLPDTAVTPFDQRTSSSRATVHTGLAALRAAEDARRQLLEAAASLLEMSPDDLRLEDGKVLGGPKPLTVNQIVNSYDTKFGGEVIGTGYFKPDHPEIPTSFGMRAGYWEGSVGLAEVAVDPDTGEVEVLRYVTGSDAGRVINPLTAHGQEEGGVGQAIGHALYEVCEYENGAFQNPTLFDYRVPATTDVPVELHSVMLERADGPGPYGSKGLGESSIITTAPAIANAVAAATHHRVRNLPMVPWKVWRAMRGKLEEGEIEMPDPRAEASS